MKREPIGSFRKMTPRCPWCQFQDILRCFCTAIQRQPPTSRAGVLHATLTVSPLLVCGVYDSLAGRPAARPSHPSATAPAGNGGCHRDGRQQQTVGNYEQPQSAGNPPKSPNEMAGKLLREDFDLTHAQTKNKTYSQPSLLTSSLCENREFLGRKTVVVDQDSCKDFLFNTSRGYRGDLIISPDTETLQEGYNKKGFENIAKSKDQAIERDPWFKISERKASTGGINFAADVPNNEHCMQNKEQQKCLPYYRESPENPQECGEIKFAPQNGINTECQNTERDPWFKIYERRTSAGGINLTGDMLSNAPSSTKTPDKETHIIAPKEETLDVISPKPAETKPDIKTICGLPILTAFSAVASPAQFETNKPKKDTDTSNPLDGQPKEVSGYSQGVEGKQSTCNNEAFIPSHNTAAPNASIATVATTATTTTSSASEKNASNSKDGAEKTSSLPSQKDEIPSPFMMSSRASQECLDKTDAASTSTKPSQPPRPATATPFSLMQKTGDNSSFLYPPSSSPSSSSSSSTSTSFSGTSPSSFLLPSLLSSLLSTTTTPTGVAVSTVRNSRPLTNMLNQSESITMTTSVQRNNLGGDGADTGTRPAQTQAAISGNDVTATGSKNFGHVTIPSQIQSLLILPELLSS